jgi:hypothetical protein
MGKLEDDQNKLYPPGSPPPPGQPPAAPTTDANAQNAVDPLTAQQNQLFPPPQPSDEDVTSNNFWNLPPGVSQEDYWTAEGRKVGKVVGQAAADTGLIFGDDMSFGMPGLFPGQTPADYRAAVEAARQRAGGGKYGIDAMAFLANKPFQAVRLGLRGGQAAAAAAERIAPNLSVDAVKQVARRVGDFVEGGAYTGAQSKGHGADLETAATDALGGGLLSTTLGGAFSAAKAAGPRIRNWVYGTPEGTPQEIAAGPPPGAPPRTPEQAMDANQLNLWRSQSKLTSPPSQADVSNYATKVYGDDPAQWPEALRDIHKAAGKEGAPSVAARIIGHSAAQAGAATANYLGLGFSPEVAAIAHPALASVTEMALPALGYGGAVAPVKGALANAYPALTGWRNAPNTPDWRVGQ